MHTVRKTKLAIASSLVIAALSAGSAQAQSGGDFYRGKTIRLIVTTDAGGGYDLASRNIARYMPNYIPGKPSFVVQNMPGAGSVKGTNYIYNVVAKDSTVMGSLGNQAPFAPMLGMDQALFDPTKFNWLGSPAAEVGLLMVWHAVPVDTIEDATKREVIMATSGGGSTSAFYARTFNSVFGTKLKVLSGYTGMTGAFLAMERGEVDGFPSAFWSSLKATKPDWIRDKKVKFLIQYGTRTANPELPDVPVARDLAKSEEDKLILDIAMAPLELGRPFVMPPGVSAEHVEIMRKALMATFADKGFIADSNKQGLEVEPTTGEALEAIIKETYGAPKPVIDRLVSLYSDTK
ncbi:MAG TPA: hypothetical protein VGO34_15350 [Alphaproteobacteria bacterium]|jgi:tripartite-type tricarboxylate transporter receptor subunit TctC